MNSILIYILFFVFSVGVEAKSTVEYRISPVHGLLKFATANSVDPHGSQNLVEFFSRSSVKDDATHRKALENLHEIQSSLSNGFEYRKDSSGKGTYFGVEEFLIVQSILARDLEDFGGRILGLLPMQEHILLMESLKTLEPFYQKEIWKNSERKLRSGKNRLEAESRKANLEEMFKKVQIFYSSPWPMEQNFTIGLYPIPYLENFKNGTTSRSMGPTEEHGIMIYPQKEDDPGFDVVFHELCHSVYNQQPYVVKKRWQEYFKNSQSRYQKAAESWLNEGVATAIGNGWANKRLTGKTPAKDWYAEPTVDGFAMGIFTEVEKYLDSDKPVDEAFIKKIVQIFAEKFPESIYQYKSALNKVAVFMDDDTSSSNVILNLRKTFHSSSIWNSAPLTAPETFGVFKTTDANMLFVFHPKNLPDLKALIRGDTRFKSHLKTILKLKAGEVYTFIEDDGRTFIFMPTTNTLQMNSIFKFMSENNIDLKKPIQKTMAK